MEETQTEAAPRRGSRTLLRIALVGGPALGTLALTAGGAFASTPAVPDGSAAIKQSVSDASNTLLTGFTDNLVYIIPVLVAFTVLSIVFGMLKLKRRPK